MRDVLIRCARALFAALFVLPFARPLLAHEWYPSDCCSDRDCWPTGSAGREPDPQEVKGGWRLSDGTFVPHRDARPSPDGRFHVCRSGGSPSGALMRSGDNQPCLWTPQGGV